MTQHSILPVAERLARLRAEMVTRHLDALLIPRYDPHMAEYVAAHDARLAWATGFSGSAGACILTAAEAVMFVDGRYSVQVRNQCPAALFSYRHLHNEPLADWIAAKTKVGFRFGFDPMHIPASWYDAFGEAAAKTGAELVVLDENLIDLCWDTQPPASTERVKAFDVGFSGMGNAEKSAMIAAKISAAGADYLVEAQPDNIAWLLNIRGADIPYNPFANSFAIVDKAGAIDWYVDGQKLPQDRSEFDFAKTEVKAEEQFLPDLARKLSAGQKVLIDADFAPVAARLAAERAGADVIASTSPVTETKAIKNAVELQGFRDCHLHDGVAWLKFGHWLETEVPKRAGAGKPVTELEAEARILAFRQEQPHFVYPSFSSISAAGGNAAMCHYKSTEASNAEILPGAPYLLDSGGQFETGTTDATRTYVFDKFSEDFAVAYTAVLQGFIGLATLQFPDGTQGHQIDGFARAPLWALGRDYDHGTGHGIGHFLSVHEHPQRLAKTVNAVDLRAGMVLSIEPGYYVANEYGIRIENLFEIVETVPGFMAFKNLSFMPIETRPVLVERLNASEKAWLNTYHQEVAERLAGFVEGDQKRYLDDKTRPI